MAIKWRWGLLAIAVFLFALPGAGAPGASERPPSRCKQPGAEDSNALSPKCAPSEYVAMLIPDTPGNAAATQSCLSKFAPDARNLADVGSCLRNIGGEREHFEQSRKKFEKWKLQKFENDACRENRTWSNCAQQLVFATCDGAKFGRDTR